MRKRLMKSVGLGSVKFEGVFCIVSIIFIFLVFNEAIFAGEKNQSIKKNFRHQWRIEQNVPRFGVLSVKQTPDGYLWLGTQEGLVRYDGVQHVVFNKDNTEAINNNVVQFLLVARSGALWLGTMGGGLVKYQDGLFTRYEISEGLSGNFVQGIAESADGTLWVGTNKGLSALLPDGNIIKNEASAVLAGKTINAVFADADETIWIGTYGDGLYSFKDGKLTQYTEKEGLLSNSVWSLAGDEKGNLWIGTRDGISRFDRRSFINYETSESGAGQTIFSVLTNRSPNILFGTGSGGVLSFDGDKFSTTGEKDGLPSDNVNSLFQDREGNIWAGTLGGLARLFEPPIETLTQADGLRGGIVSAIYEEKPGRIWIGTNEGLNLFENGKFADAPLIKAVGRTPVYSILDDGAGSLLIGTKGKGLFQLKKNRITQLSTANGLPNDVIFTLLKGKQGDLWIGTYGGGLVKVTPDKKLSIYTVKNGLISNLISALHEDGAGRLWIVTKDGISRFFEGKFENFALGENGLPSNEIYAVREAPRDSGNVWLGTDGGGLVRYKNGNFRVVSRADGLTQDAVFGLKDDDKSLWLAGSRGISRISLTQLNEKLNGNQQLLRPLEFGIAEGMASEYCVGGSQSTIAQMEDGSLWFGTIKGVAVINPVKLKSNSVVPPVVIEKVIVNDQSVRNLEAGLAANSSRFEFQYTGLSLTLPEKMQFRYRLEGFDKDWINAGTRRTAYYTNLPPGNYTFRVKAANNNGVWNETGASVSFSKLPYFYQTNWFVALCGGAFILFLFALHQLRLRTKLAREQARHRAVLEERTRLSREIHDTLTQGLAAIHSQLQAAAAAAANSASNEKYVASASQIARESLAEARRWIKSLRSENLSNDKLTTSVQEFAEQMDKTSNARVSCEFRGDEPPLSVEVKQNLLRIAQESVTNAVKHAAPKNIRIKIEYAEELRLDVIDDGDGFTVEDAVGGFGLRGMRERAELIGAKLAINSAAQNGTYISLCLPLKPASYNHNGNYLYNKDFHETEVSGIVGGNKFDN